VPVREQHTVSVTSLCKQDSLPLNHLRKPVFLLLCATLSTKSFKGRRRGSMPSESDMKEVGGRTAFCNSNQNPFDSDPAATFPIHSLTGFEHQKVDGFLSSLSKGRTKRLVALVLAPKFRMKRLSISPPSSVMKQCPLVSNATFSETVRLWVPCTTTHL
jgi:hypothetical protein